jgi:hypothetical protein
VSLSAKAAALIACCGGSRSKGIVMPTTDFAFSEYIKAGSEALVLLKTLYPLLPTQNRDEVEAKIHAAEEALQKANVALAQAWDYHLCQCTFPPQIMLWREKEKGHFCPRPECGRNTAQFNREIPTLKTGFF